MRRKTNSVMIKHYRAERHARPIDLAVFYPYPPTIDWPRVALCAIVLVIITLFVFLRMRRQRFLLAGWPWVLVVMIPMNGLVQAGAQAMADRYAYLPLIGVYIMIAFSIDNWRGSAGGIARRVVAPVAIAACIALSCRQVRFWSSSETLFRHAIA